MRRVPVPAVLLLAVVLALQGCGRRPGRGVEIKGSDTMVNLAQAWAEAYTKAHPDANIVVTGGGSGTGIAALINGDVDIAQASREMKEQELEQARERGMDPQEFIVAQDGVSIIVNPANVVGELTIEQLSDIYTGRAATWKQLGGADAKIVVLARDRSSGTHIVFLEYVVRKGEPRGPEEYARSALMMPSSQAVADEVAGNEAAVGYVGTGYVDETRHRAVAVAQDPDSPYVEPSEENVLSGAYLITRPLHFYTPNPPEGTIRDFIDFALSDEGQKIVREQEFVPITETH